MLHLTASLSNQHVQYEPVNTVVAQDPSEPLGIDVAMQRTVSWQVWKPSAITGCMVLSLCISMVAPADNAITRPRRTAMAAASLPSESLHLVKSLNMTYTAT